MNPILTNMSVASIYDKPQSQRELILFFLFSVFLDVQPFTFPNLPLPVICLFVTVLSLTLLSIHSVVVVLEKRSAYLSSS